MDSTEDEVSLLDVLPPSSSKCLHDPVRPVLAHLNSWDDLLLHFERSPGVEERWLSSSQGLQDWPGGNSHQTQLIPEVWVCDPCHTPTAFCSALSVNKFLQV